MDWFSDDLFDTDLVNGMDPKMLLHIPDRYTVNGGNFGEGIRKSSTESMPLPSLPQVNTSTPSSSSLMPLSSVESTPSSKSHVEANFLSTSTTLSGSKSLNVGSSSSSSSSPSSSLKSFALTNTVAVSSIPSSSSSSIAHVETGSTSLLDLTSDKVHLNEGINCYDDEDDDDENEADEDTDDASRGRRRIDVKDGGSMTVEGVGDQSPTMALKTKAKNREHAKNTRIRKKNYIETLKDTVHSLAEEREVLDQGQRVMLTMVAEQFSIRRKVLQTFFIYRSTNERCRNKWVTIVEENFKLVLPVTPYRAFPASEVVDTQRHINGIDGLIEDTNSLRDALQSILCTNSKDEHGIERELRYQYYCGPDDCVIGSDTVMCRWALRTDNAVECGARYECFKHGMMKATFSPLNKLVTVEQLFDVMSFMHQLRRASGSLEFSLVGSSSAAPEEDTTTLANSSNDDLTKIDVQTAVPGMSTDDVLLLSAGRRYDHLSILEGSNSDKGGSTDGSCESLEAGLLDYLDTEQI